MSIWGPLAARFEPKEGVRPQRKMLALDGGGIRGVLTLEILLELEQQLRAAHGNDPAYRLCDFFDYIGGTSTGAIIAAGLARGLSAAELLQFYQDKGEAMFDKTWLLKKVKYFYNDGPLQQALQETFGTGDISLESGDFKSLLLIVTMNRSTDSPWPISNNPLAKYNDKSRLDCNLRIPLYQLVRAGTAAPAYFRPETLQWDKNNPEKTFVFVDGGVTPYNNPAFLMYRMATQEAFKLCWPTGEKKLMIVSVGTGASASPGTYSNVFDTLKSLPNNLLYAMQVDQDINCRTIGHCVYGAPIDREMGNLTPLDDDLTPTGLDSDADRHFSYVRYNADLSPEGLAALGCADLDSDEISEMDTTRNIPDLRRVGKAVGKTQVNVKEHLRDFIPA